MSDYDLIITLGLLYFVYTQYKSPLTKLWHQIKEYLVEREMEKEDRRSCKTCDRDKNCAGNDSGRYPCPDYIEMKIF